MSVEYFLDTNVLVYAHTTLDPVKQRIASAIIQNHSVVVSTQVVQEFINVLNRKKGVAWPTVRQLVSQITANCLIYQNATHTINQACLLAERYGYGFYDCLILAAAMETGVSVIYSEDMHHQQEIAGRLKIVNPFLSP